VERPPPEDSPAGPRRRRRWVGGLLLVVALCALAWAGVRLGPNVPIYLRNLRVRASMSDADVTAFGGRLLIVAPHPDDETLGCAGLIQQAQAKGVEVFVVLLTNGDGYQHERTLMVAEDVLRGTSREHLDLGARRRTESLRALAGLGVPADHVLSLGYPDGGVHAMWQPQHWSPAQPYRSPHTRNDHNPYPTSLSPGAPYCGAQLIGDLLQAFESKRPTAILTTASFDVHRDHWATYGFARLAAEWMRRHGGTDIPVYGFLIHRHDWPAPQGYHPREPLEPPAAWLHTPLLTWLMVDLTSEQVETKDRCLGRYRSQNAGHSAELLAFVRRNELFSRLETASPTDDEVSIPDPTGDLPPDRLLPEEDIAELTVARAPAGCTVSLRLAARPSRDLTYCAIWHGLNGNQPWARSVEWGRGGGRLLQASGSRPLRTAPLDVKLTDRALTWSVPPGAVPGGPIMLEAYSLRNGRYLNHTCTVLADLGGEAHGPPAGK